MLVPYLNLLTEKGSALHARTIAGEKMQITRFELGNGTYTGTENEAAVAKMTALKSPKNSYGVSKVEFVNTATCKLTLTATNEKITAGYYVTEIGIYAKGEDGKEVLYAVIIADPEHPDWMSAYNSVAPGSLKYYDFISVGNAENVTIAPGSGGVLSVDDIATVEETREYLAL
jgi:hypothetical protein